MKIKLIRNLGIDTRGNVPGNPKKGAVHDVDPARAETLITRGLAVALEVEEVAEPVVRSPVPFLPEDEPEEKPRAAPRRKRKPKTETNKGDNDG